jgi:hypothetical protein
MKPRREILILACALMAATIAGHAQGAFTFNTRRLVGEYQNNIRFVDVSGIFLSGPDIFVQVFAGPVSQGRAGLQPLPNPLPLNRTGAGAGYTDPLQRTYTVPFTGEALIGYGAYRGSSWDTATSKFCGVATTRNGGIGTEPLVVQLQVAPNLPLEVFLGVGASGGICPEPTTLMMLFAGGLGILLLQFRRRA